MDVCLACMATYNQINLHPISGNRIIFDLYNQFTGLEIDLNDGLPNVLCETCMNKLLEFRVFRTKCITSNKLLRENLGIKHENPEILNGFLDTNEILDTLNDLVKNENHVCQDERPETDTAHYSDHATKMLESDSEGDDNPKEAAEDTSYRGSDKESEMDSDEIASRKYVQEQEQLKKKRKNYTFPYKCARCDRGFRYEERLLGHMREHKGHRAAVCEFCNREYTEWSGLQKHINQCHKDEIKYICNYCGKKFLYESALEAHKITHSGPRQHICETCGKSFSNNHQLNKHKLAHTDKTPFECDACGKKFKSLQRLKTHQYRHTGIKKFVCPTCNKGFTTSPELRQHLIIHSDTKSFKCNLCQQLFRQRSQLSTHKRSHLF